VYEVDLHTTQLDLLREEVTELESRLLAIRQEQDLCAEFRAAIEAANAENRDRAHELEELRSQNEDLQMLQEDLLEENNEFEEVAQGLAQDIELERLATAAALNEVSSLQANIAVLGRQEEEAEALKQIRQAAEEQLGRLANELHRREHALQLAQLEVQRTESSFDDRQSELDAVLQRNQELEDEYEDLLYRLNAAFEELAVAQHEEQLAKASLSQQREELGRQQQEDARRNRRASMERTASAPLDLDHHHHEISRVNSNICIPLTGGDRQSSTRMADERDAALEAMGSAKARNIRSRQELEQCEREAVIQKEAEERQQHEAAAQKEAKERQQHEAAAQKQAEERQQHEAAAQKEAEERQQRREESVASSEGTKAELDAQRGSLSQEGGTIGLIRARECTVLLEEVVPLTISAERMLATVGVPTAQFAEDLTTEWPEGAETVDVPPAQHVEHLFAAEGVSVPNRTGRSSAPKHADDDDLRLTRVHNHPLSFHDAPGPVVEGAFSYPGQPRKASIVTTTDASLGQSHGKHLVDGHTSLVGWLFKRGAGGLRGSGWKQRWFSYLQGSAKVYYYKNQLDANKKGSDMGDIAVYKVRKVCQTLDSADDPTQYGFTVHTDKRQWYFCALNPDEQKLWIKLFEAFIVGAGKLEI
jgi:hypothetical protein